MKNYQSQILPILKMFKTNRSKKGFTLVELLIYAAILAVLISVMAEILYSFLNTQLSTQSTSNVAMDGRYIYSRLIYDINRAQSVSLPANLGDSSNTLNLVINAQNYSYFIASPSGNLQITDNTGSYSLNGSDTQISDLQFVRIGNVSGKQTFQINFKVTSEIPVNSRYDSQEFETVAGLR